MHVLHPTKKPQAHYASALKIKIDTQAALAIMNTSVACPILRSPASPISCDLDTSTPICPCRRASHATSSSRKSSCSFHRNLSLNNRPQIAVSSVACASETAQGCDSTTEYLKASIFLLNASAPLALGERSAGTCFRASKRTEAVISYLNYYE